MPIASTAATMTVVRPDLPWGQRGAVPDGEQPIYTPQRYSTQDAWFGRSLPMPSYDLGYENPARLIVAARVLRTSYTQRPTPDSGAKLRTRK